MRTSVNPIQVLIVQFFLVRTQQSYQLVDAGIPFNGLDQIRFITQAADQEI